MNRNATPLILIILSLGIYFSFTRIKIDEWESIKVVNAKYKETIDNSNILIKKIDDVLAEYNKIDPLDQERIEKIIPDNVDNVRLIIDVNAVASRHGLSVKNIKTSTPKDSGSPKDVNSDNSYDTVTLSFDTNGSYQAFQDFLRDLEASLRILEISRISLKVSDAGIFDYGVEIKTFWLKN